MIIAIVGPTGVGKTKLSIELAKTYQAIIINCDAVQIYKELNIGTAKIKETEKEGITHYLFDIKSPSEEYSVKEYQMMARKIIAQNKDKNIIFVGGTGLYLAATLKDYRFYEDENYQDYHNYSNEELYNLALKKDENMKINLNNRIRLIRFLQKDLTQITEPKTLYKAYLIGLTTKRQQLYQIINQRVDNMIQKGLLDEVKNLYLKYPDSKILKRAIGYKELIAYLNNEISLEEAINKIKLNSRHYAKRQYTWFNKMAVKWFEVNYDDFVKTITEVKNYLASLDKN